MMQTRQITQQDMLNDLLLNQAFSKRDIARTLSIGMPLIERLLSSDQSDVILGEQPECRLNRLYKRMKQYESLKFDGSWQVNLSFFQSSSNIYTEESCDE